MAPKVRDEKKTLYIQSYFIFFYSAGMLAARHRSSFFRRAVRKPRTCQINAHHFLCRWATAVAA